MLSPVTNNQLMLIQASHLHFILMTKILKYIFAIITTLSRPLALDREIHYSVEATFRR